MWYNGSMSCETIPPVRWDAEELPGNIDPVDRSGDVRLPDWMEEPPEIHHSTEESPEVYPSTERHQGAIEDLIQGVSSLEYVEEVWTAICLLVKQQGLPRGSLLGYQKIIADKFDGSERTMAFNKMPIEGDNYHMSAQEELGGLGSPS